MPNNKPQPQRRVAFGSTYRVDPIGPFGEWILTADGIALCAPTTYDRALAAFHALVDGEWEPITLRDRPSV